MVHRDRDLDLALMECEAPLNLLAFYAGGISIDSKLGADARAGSIALLESRLEMEVDGSLALTKGLLKSPTLVTFNEALGTNI